MKQNLKVTLRDQPWVKRKLCIFSLVKKLKSRKSPRELNKKLLLTDDDEASVRFFLRLLWVFTESKETKHDCFLPKNEKSRNIEDHYFKSSN